MVASFIMEYLGLGYHKLNGRRRCLFFLGSHPPPFPPLPSSVSRFLWFSLEVAATEEAAAALTVECPFWPLILLSGHLEIVLQRVLKTNK